MFVSVCERGRAFKLAISQWLRFGFRNKNKFLVLIFNFLLRNRWRFQVISGRTRSHVCLNCWRVVSAVAMAVCIGTMEHKSARMKKNHVCGQWPAERMFSFRRFTIYKSILPFGSGVNFAPQFSRYQQQSDCGEYIFSNCVGCRFFFISVSPKIAATNLQSTPRFRECSSLFEFYESSV